MPYYLSYLVNVFSIKKTFLLPLFSDGKNLYFQRTKDNIIESFDITSLEEFEGSEYYLVTDYEHVFMPGDYAVVSIQVSPNRRFVGDALTVMLFSKWKKSHIRPHSALYDNLNHFIDNNFSVTNPPPISTSELLGIFRSSIAKKKNTMILFSSEARLLSAVHFYYSAVSFLEGLDNAQRKNQTSDAIPAKGRKSTSQVADPHRFANTLYLYPIRTQGLVLTLSKLETQKLQLDKAQLSSLIKEMELIIEAERLRHIIYSTKHARRTTFTISEAHRNAERRKLRRVEFEIAKMALARKMYESSDLNSNLKIARSSKNA